MCHAPQMFRFLHKIHTIVFTILSTMQRAKMHLFSIIITAGSVCDLENYTVK